MFASTNGFEDRHGVISVVRETDAIVAFCLAGDFDLTNAPALGDQLDRTLQSGNGVIVDLSQATFIDSSVIHVCPTRSSRRSSAFKLESRSSSGQRLIREQPP